MINVIFTLKGMNTIIQCNKEDKLKDICNKYAHNMGIDINLIYFLYNGIILDFDLNQQIDIIVKDKNEMNILVYEKYNSTVKTDESIIQSKEIICPKCKENCKIKINDYKINFYDCKNNHEINNILLDEFINTQHINELEIICNICNNINKAKAFDKQFYLCLICKKNLCPLCKSIHDSNHKIIDYDKKNYICNEHKEIYTSYCKECKMNLCLQCEKEHNNHELIKYINILLDENKIKEEMKEFRNKIEKLNNKINNIIKILNKIKENIEVYYKINNDIINNYKIEDRNYEILYNINEIKNNIKIKDIDEIINDNNINNEFKNILNIYNRMIIKEINNTKIINEKNKKNIDKSRIIKDETEVKNKEENNKKIKDIKKMNNNNDQITIIYKINKNDTKIKLFGYSFIKNNKDKCKYIYDNKEYELELYFKLSNKNKDKLIIKLKGIKNVTNISYMFNDCSSLLSLPDIYNWNTNKVTNISYMFNSCSSLSSLPDISKLNTNNITDISYMFNSCKLLSSLPDISKWNTENVTDISYMFNGCSSLSSLPDISKWNTDNVINMSSIFYDCSSLTSLPDISKWNTNNVTNMINMFKGCKDSLNIPFKFK